MSDEKSQEVAVSPRDSWRLTPFVLRFNSHHMSPGLWVPGVTWPATTGLLTEVKRAESVWSKHNLYEFIFDQWFLGSRSMFMCAPQYFINFLNGLWDNQMSHRLNFALSTERSLRELAVIFAEGLPAGGDKSCCFQTHRRLLRSDLLTFYQALQPLSGRVWDVFLGLTISYQLTGHLPLKRRLCCPCH